MGSSPGQHDTSGSVNAETGPGQLAYKQGFQETAVGCWAISANKNTWDDKEHACLKRDCKKNCTHALPFDAILFIVINYFYYQEVSAPLITLANALSRACVNAGK